MINYFRLFTQHLIRSELIRNASVLISGTILAQAISLILQPFLRRHFSPEVFGTFSVYLSFVGIIVIIASLKYDDAIVLPRRDKDSANLLILSVFASFIFNLILFVVILIWGRQFLRILNISENFSVSILYLIPFSAFLYSSFQNFNYWLIRKKKYMAVSTNKLTRRGVEGGAQILFAIFKNTRGLIFGDVIGQISNNTAVVYQSYRNGFNFKDFNPQRVSYLIRKYSEFPKYNLIPAFMSACSYLLPPIFINKHYSSINAGYFDLSKLLLSIPLALVATAISNVLLQRISEKFRQGKSILADIKPVLFIILVIIFFEVLIIMLYGVDLFKFAFGQEWGFSGEISKILVWSFALNFIVSSFSVIFIAMKKIKVYSLWQFFYFCAIVVLFMVKGLTFVSFLKIYMFVEALCYIAAIITMLFIVRKYELSLKGTN